MTVATGRGIEILLVEDSPTDRLITIDALERAKVLNSLNTVENGEEAMAYLRREGRYADARRPDLILLDLNLPRKDGREVLAEIKSDPSLKFIPVIVMTTSSAEEDVALAYGEHANSFITKPIDLNRFAASLGAVGNYWFEVVTLPSTAAIERLVRQAPPRRPIALHGSERVKVLLIEDSEVDALLVHEALSSSRSFTFELTRVSRLAAALSKLRSEHFDIVLTDLGLPDSQGLETCRRVKAACLAVPLIVLTGHDDEETGLRALHEGAVDYLVKGELTARALARAVRYAIDRQNIEELLRHAQRVDAIGQVAGGVAHDFNNLLTIIQANAALISTVSAAELPELATDILQSVTRGASLTRQLLAFSRKQILSPVDLDLNEVVGNFTRMLRRTLSEGIHLEVQLAQQLPSIHADVGMLEQVIMNLAVNARDAMPGGGKVTLQTSDVTVDAVGATRYGPTAYSGQFVKLVVKDTGCGIAPEHLTRIWEPFFSTKDVNHGTGLGLATVYGIVRQHRGWMHVESKIGGGTSFSVFLPASPRTEAVAETASVAGLEAAVPLVREATLLIVDDEAMIRTVAKRMLAGQGYRVLEAGSGVEALQLWATHQGTIDLLLTDLVMPDGIDGRSLAAQLLAKDPKLRVIFSSGYSNDLGSEGFELVEGVNFLPKPYSPKGLRAIVHEQLILRAAALAS